MYEATSPLISFLSFTALVLGVALGAALHRLLRAFEAWRAGWMAFALCSGLGLGVSLGAFGPVATSLGALLAAIAGLCVVLIQGLAAPDEEPYSTTFITSRIGGRPSFPDLVSALSLRPAPSHISHIG